MNGSAFGLIEVEVIGNMSLRNYESLVLGYGIQVTNGIAEFVFCNDAFSRNLAKNTSYRSIFVTLCDCPSSYKLEQSTA